MSVKVLQDNTVFVNEVFANGLVHSQRIIMEVRR